MPRQKENGQTFAANSHSEPEKSLASLPETLDRIVSDLPKVNSEKRRLLHDQLIQLCVDNVILLEEIITYFYKYEGSNGHYALQVIDKVMSSEKVAKAVIGLKRVASADLLVLLAACHIRLKKKTSLLLKTYFEPYSMGSPVNMEYARVANFEKIAESMFEVQEFCRAFGTELLEALFTKTRDGEILAILAGALHDEAERTDRQTNLVTLLNFGGMDVTLPAEAEINGAIAYTLHNVEIGFTGRTENYFFERQLKNIAKVLSMNLKRQVDPMSKEVLDLSGGGDPYTFGWSKTKKEFKAFFQDKSKPFFELTLPRRGELVIDLANHLNVGRELIEFEKSDEFNISSVILPDEGSLVFISRKGAVSDEQAVRMMQEQLKRYYKTVDLETIYPTYLEFLLYVCKIMIPDVEKEIVTRKVEENRMKAAGGLSTVSGRGDRAILRVKNSSGDKYLNSLGIREIVFTKEDTGISCEVAWFNMSVTFSIDQNYRLIPIEGMNPTHLLWIENLLLSYIAGIKQKTGVIEAPTEKNEEPDEERQHLGKRPHLKVLHLGHETRKTDLQDPTRTSVTEALFVQSQFGVSLYTLNKVFHTVQEDITYLKRENFYILLEEYEKHLEHLLVGQEVITYELMRMRTDADTVRAIIIEAVKRTTHRKQKVRYQKDGLHAEQEGNNGTSLESTNEFFSITMVHESKPHEEIEVEPIRVWFPEVSKEIEQLVSLS